MSTGGLENFPSISQPVASLPAHRLVVDKARQHSAIAISDPVQEPWLAMNNWLRYSRSETMPV
jgi:hypothetical protein